MVTNRLTLRFESVGGNKKMIRDINVHLSNYGLFLDFIGISIDSLRDGFAEVSLSIRDEYLNSSGTVLKECVYILSSVAATYVANLHCYDSSVISSNYNALEDVKNVDKLKASARVAFLDNNILYTTVDIITDKETPVGKGSFIHSFSKLKSTE